jgi:hypothetical protein
MKLPYFTFADFCTLEPSYQLELKAFYDVGVWDGKVSGNVCNHLSRCTVEQVWLIRRIFREQQAEAFPDVVATTCKMSTEQVMQSSSFEVYRAIGKAVEDAVKLSKMEETRLQYPKDQKYEQAAGDKMDQFDLYNTLDALTDRDRSKWEWAKKLNYQTAFTILHKNCIEAEIQREYQRLLNPKGR